MSKPAQSEKVVRDRAFELDALPWIDAVYRLALSLTRDEAAAGDVVEDTFLRAYESWHTYVPGSDCRRWLLAICRDVVLRSREDPSPLAAGAPERRDALAAAHDFWAPATDGGRESSPSLSPRTPARPRPAAAAWPGPFIRVVPIVS